jgi:hypothetical protein
MSLKESQRDFIQYLYAPKPTDDQQRRARELFLSADKPDPGNGMKIYRKNLLFGMLLALEDTYPFTRALLGANNFNFLCREYIYSHPSQDSDLTVYGGELGDFLSGRPEISPWPYIADVARLEWARDRAFYARPEKALRFSPEKLKPEVTLPIRQSLALIESVYGLLEPFELFMEKGLEALPQNPFKAQPEILAVWAEGGEPRQRRVTPQVAALIGESRAGKNLEAVGRQAFFASNPQALAGALLFLADQGWLVAPEAP